MRKTDVRRRFLSSVMTLVLLMSMIPAVYATSDGKCSCGATYNRSVLHQANCHEYGVVEYICPNTACQDYNKSVLVKTPMDPNYHDAVYKDNGDGATHTATCLYHSDYRNVSEAHTFVNGYCTKCAAADYSQAVISLSKNIDIYVSLRDTDAALSIGSVALMVGSTDVTDDYTVSYSWMDQSGATVGNKSTYSLPASITAKEGDYIYGCFVMAMPKAGTAGKYISESCTVTVHVRDLILAEATVDREDPALTMAATNSRTSVSVAQQIYQAAYKLSSGYPSYVIFGSRSSADIGVLTANTGAYYFSPTTGQQDLSTVSFTPTGAATGICTVNFTVYDTKGNDFPGVLTVSVDQDLGSLDVFYATTPGAAVQLRAADFNAFWQKTYSKGAVTMLYFKSLPTVNEGVLYYNYIPGALNNKAVTPTDVFSSTYSSTTQMLIDALTFVPDAKFTGSVKIPFEVYGLTDAGQYVFLKGDLVIFVSAGTVSDVTYSAISGSAVKFSSDDFMTVHRLATGTTDNFSIKLMDVPLLGALYTDYTGTLKDTPLTAASVSDYTFHYSSAVGSEISDLTYISPKSTTAATQTIRYAACDSKGTLLYVGEIVISCKSAVVVYTKSFTDVPKTSSTEWYYTAVMDLAEAGVINGMTDTTFEPGGKVTYGQALKLILLAAGYEKQTEESGPYWAKNYLTLAQKEGLISTAYTETILSRVIARNEIAQIAAKAMKLPASALTVSPFTDVLVGSTYAPYIFSLYDAGIITGTELSNGTTVYYGVNAITRAEMAVIVWRINNYRA